jgi:hypothetical protein
MMCHQPIRKFSRDALRIDRADTPFPRQSQPLTRFGMIDLTINQVTPVGELRSRRVSMARQTLFESAILEHKA